MKFSKTALYALLALFFAALPAAQPAWAQSPSDASSGLAEAGKRLKALVPAARLVSFDAAMAAADKALSKRRAALDGAKLRWLSLLATSASDGLDGQALAAVLREAIDAALADSAAIRVSLQAALREAQGNKAYAATAAELYSAAVRDLTLPPELLALIPGWKAYKAGHAKASDYAALLSAALCYDPAALLSFLSTAEPDGRLAALWSEAKALSRGLDALVAMVADYPVGAGTGSMAGPSFLALTAYLESQGTSGLGALKAACAGLDAVGLVGAFFIALGPEGRRFYCKEAAISQPLAARFTAAFYRARGRLEPGEATQGDSELAGGKPSEETLLAYVLWRSALAAGSPRASALAFTLAERPDAQALFAQGGAGHERLAEFQKALSERLETTLALARADALGSAGAFIPRGPWTRAGESQAILEAFPLASRPFRSALALRLAPGGPALPVEAFGSAAMASLWLSGGETAPLLAGGQADGAWALYALSAPDGQARALGLPLLWGELAAGYGPSQAAGFIQPEPWLMEHAATWSAVWAVHQDLALQAAGLSSARRFLGALIAEGTAP